MTDPSSPLNQTERDALRYVAGVPGAFPPKADVVERLCTWGFVAMTFPGAWMICERYSETSAGASLLAQIGDRG